MEPEKLAHLRHTLSHLLAAAVLELYPDAKPTLGPAIDNGFYYDIQFTEPPKDADLAAVEKNDAETFAFMERVCSPRSVPR
jgi:threonyl-tRNA synthetase